MIERLGERERPDGVPAAPGAAFAAWAGGASRSWFGTYTPAFVTAGVLCVAAVGLSLRIGRPRRVRLGAPEPALG